MLVFRNSWADSPHQCLPLTRATTVNVDFPAWMVESLDREADRLGVTRQSLIKMWIAERLERVAS